MCYEKIVYNYINYIKDNYNKILREPSGILKHKFIVPGTGYQQQLWDWDSWLTDVAISQVAIKENTLEFSKTSYKKLDLKKKVLLYLCYLRM